MFSYSCADYDHDFFLFHARIQIALLLNMLKSAINVAQWVHHKHNQQRQAASPMPHIRCCGTSLVASCTTCYAAYDYWSMCQTVRYYGPDWLGTRTTRAALRTVRSIGSWRDPTEHLMGASRGPNLVGPERLNCYAIGTTASADPRGIFPPAHDWDGSPFKVIRHSTRRATLPFGGAGLSSGSVRWRTRKRTTAGGPGGVMDT
jgi:hypothetical protein